MSKTQLLVDEFENDCYNQGWVESGTSYCREAEEKYNASKKSLLDRISELEKSAKIPLEPTEEMIRAACLNQCFHVYSSYEKWADSHSTGIVEKIRQIIITDYIAMMRFV